MSNYMTLIVSSVANKISSKEIKEGEVWFVKLENGHISKFQILKINEEIVELLAFPIKIWQTPIYKELANTKFIEKIENPSEYDI